MTTDATTLALPAGRQPIDRWTIIGWKFAAPGLTIIAIVIGLPLVYALLLSLSSFTLLHPRLSPFVGLEHFRRIAADEYFWHSVWLTIKYSGLTVGVEFLLCLFVALMRNRVVRLKAGYFAILAFPMATS